MIHNVNAMKSSLNDLEAIKTTRSDLSVHGSILSHQALNLVAAR